MKPLVTAESELTKKRAGKGMKPMNYDQVLQAASPLNILDKSELCKELKRQIATEVDARKSKVTLAEEEFNEAQEAISGL